MYIYIYRERERESASDRESEREKKRQGRNLWVNRKEYVGMCTLFGIIGKQAE